MPAQTFKIMVRVQPSSLELVRYIHKNLTHINRRGIRVSISKLADSEFDEEFVTRLSRKGITRMPAMIDSQGVAYVGLKQIMDVFEGQAQRARSDQRLEIPAAEFGSDPLLSNYWQKEMFNYDRGSGTFSMRTDDEEHEGDASARTIERQMRMYEDRVPRQRRSADPVDIDGRAMRHGRARAGRRRDDDRAGGGGGYDNIDSDDDMRDERDDYDERDGRNGRDMRVPDDDVPFGSSGGGGDAFGDALDQKMLSAWMNNNGPSAE